MLRIVAFCPAMIAGLLLLIGSASPQQKKDDQQKDEAPIRVNTELVSFTVTVTDPYNRLVAGLNQRHFEVYEDKQGQSLLEEIAQSTGGKAFFPRSAAELEDITTRIALVLRHQYSLGYVPTNEQRNGKWRKIRVRVKPPRGLPSLNVRAKEGYYAVP